MTSSPESRPTFTVVDLLAGLIVFSVLGWLLGGLVGWTFQVDWKLGSQIGFVLGVALFFLLVVRKIWIEMNALAMNPSPELKPSEKNP
jgi:uncharacterized membrane protein